MATPGHTHNNKEEEVEGTSVVVAVVVGHKATPLLMN